MRRTPMRRSGLKNRNQWMGRLARVKTAETAIRVAAAAGKALGEDPTKLWIAARHWVSRRRERGERPGVTPPMPKDWKARCRKVRIRDKGACRRCGTVITGAQGAIDHIIPRRIASERRVHALSNLALLCTFNGEASCHSMKTQTIEPELYRGNVQPFERFLAIIGDPLPSPQTIGRAYARIKELTCPA